ncbi:MAG TPA: succinate dehydrogenase, cytochrome b556 subunit [Dongiaceae bacterium]|jgi:succinate dehydrogenase / fumarate reductase cytochrome b subunit|nr:succinate dehydrogenase, cytochrome b556 subunit [Dongiaceae bacterium]
MKTRPLSPHIEIYRPQLTSILSVAHRGSGIVLALGLPVLVLWFVALSRSAEAFHLAQSWAGSWVGRVALLVWSLCFFYHLLNGVRHLFWDVGMGYGLKATYRSGYAVVVLACALTAIAWIVGIFGARWIG